MSCEEVFGPVVTVNAVDSLDEAIELANGTRYGLQAGIFTSSLDTALRAARELDFGGVTVNEAPTFRADQMPYGGVKDSGNTREGPHYAVRELTEEHLVVIALVVCEGVRRGTNARDRPRARNHHRRDHLRLRDPLGRHRRRPRRASRCSSRSCSASAAAPSRAGP